MSRSSKSGLVLGFSVVPGLAHFYLGQRKKAIGLFIVDLGVLLTFLLSGSYILKLLMINVYIVTFLPACLETYNLEKGRHSRINTDSRWYVTVLLITTGLNAIPLLWQNDKLTRKFKITWTILVPVLGFLFFFGLISYWAEMEGYLERVLSKR